jgi:hypothetical protein
VSPRAHLLLGVLTLGSLAFIVRLVRGQRLKAKYSLLWLSVGGAMLVLVAVPGLDDRLARAVGISYEPGLFILLGLAFLLLVVVQFSYELSRMENRIRTLAEEVTFLRHALDDRDELSDPDEAPRPS